jgi:hypothetical protein
MVSHGPWPMDSFGAVECNLVACPNGKEPASKTGEPGDPWLWAFEPPRYRSGSLGPVAHGSATRWSAGQMLRETGRLRKSLPSNGVPAVVYNLQSSTLCWPACFAAQSRLYGDSRLGPWCKPGLCSALSHGSIFEMRPDLQSIPAWALSVEAAQKTENLLVWDRAPGSPSIFYYFVTFRYIAPR